MATSSLDVLVSSLPAVAILAQGGSRGPDGVLGPTEVLRKGWALALDLTVALCRAGPIFPGPSEMLWEGRALAPDLAIALCRPFPFFKSSPELLKLMTEECELNMSAASTTLSLCPALRHSLLPQPLGMRSPHAPAPHPPPTLRPPYPLLGEFSVVYYRRVHPPARIHVLLSQGGGTPPAEALISFFLRLLAPHPCSRLIWAPPPSAS